MAALAVLLLIFLAPPLGAEPRSPYHLQHADDAVPWREWGGAAVAEARQRGVPVLLVLGYASCRWCRVLADEHFHDPAFARQLEEAFVPVLVDRELRPALDGRMRRFMEARGGRYGWPALVALTPAGHPLAGTLYRRPTALRRWLDELAAAWREDGPTLAQAAARRARGAQAAAAPAEGPPVAQVRRLYQDVLARADPFFGGYGEQAKFPYPAHLLGLLELLAAVPDEALTEFLHTTLEAMAASELHDHLGGGFFRYAQSPDWSDPHYEKMLADNAQLARLYLCAGVRWGRTDWVRVGRRALDFLLRDMRLPEGGFASALSAMDADGEDGGAYRIHPRELARLPVEWRRRAASRWGLQGPFTEAAGWLPRPPAGPADEALDEALRAVRGRAAQDDKWLAADNALALEALVTAARLTGERRYAQASEALARLLLTRLDEGRRPVHALYRGRAVGERTLEDWAYPARALWWWGRSTADGAPPVAVERLVTDALARFHGPAGWRRSEDDPLPDVLTATALPDRERPSPSAILLALARLPSDPEIRRRAPCLETPPAEGEAFWYPATLAARLPDGALACPPPGG